ncbi:unnamed protein product [Ilex paraguariensis]|uniref:Cytochrome P450 n=1 Tax=Ilex paraguariensis TaxID=185542 RepID=A0ABC8UBY2_9AQUA
MVKMLWRHNHSESTVGSPPGNNGFPLIGETMMFMVAINSNKGFYDFVRIRRLRYGNCFKTNLFGETHVFVSSTESAKTILNNDLGKFTKRYIRSIGELVGDQSLLCASHQHHKFIRSRLNNLFTTASISLFITQFDELVIQTLSTWEQTDTVIVLEEALKMTFRAMCKILMSLESEHELEVLQKDVGYVVEGMLAFPLRLPWTRFHKGLQARERIMNALNKIVNERRRRRGLEDHDPEDFLHYLLIEDDKAICDGAPSLTDVQIKDNILTMIIAGQDTTASAITWMVKYLDENQEVLDKLRAEQLSIAEKTSPKSYLTLESLNDMPYASKVVKESLRMASIVPWFPRLALQDCELQGYKIKKGSNIHIDTRSIHLDPMVYSDPEKFIPSRFDEDSKPYSFLAFGTGGRTCLGMNLARAMMLVFLHRFVTNYRWQVIDSDSSIDKWALFAKLRSGCPVHVTRMTKNTTPT